MPDRSVLPRGTGSTRAEQGGDAASLNVGVDYGTSVALYHHPRYVWGETTGFHTDGLRRQPRYSARNKYG